MSKNVKIEEKCTHVSRYNYIKTKENWIEVIFGDKPIVESTIPVRGVYHD